MNFLRAYGVVSSLMMRVAFFLSLAGCISACGAVSSPDGITANMLVLVTDPEGGPVPGATVWIPADSPAPVQLLAAEDPLALVDEQGNACADPPTAALSAACTDADGMALLPCGGNGVFLVNYFKDDASGATAAKCGEGGVVPAPFDP